MEDITYIESLKVLKKNTKNPIKILYIKFSSWTLNKLIKTLNIESNNNKTAKHK